MVRRFAIALMAAPLLLVLHAESAAGAPPSNDTVAGATPVMPGFSEELDTREATTDADDAQLNATCGAPATDASVWYTLSTAVDTEVFVDVFESDYSAAALIGVGTPGNLDTVACGLGRVGFPAAAGTIYYVLAIDYQGDEGGIGGTLRIAFNDGSVLPTVDITIDPIGRVNVRTGVATISGTYTCTNAAFPLSLSGNARQDIGRLTIVGDFLESFDADTCDGTTRSWLAFVVPTSNGLVGGKAMTVASALNCSGSFGCDLDVDERMVQLRGGG